MVATPIGNLQDITLRALEILKSVDVIAAEDTRHTAGLLAHFAIQKKLIAVHDHNERKAAEQLLTRLQAGESIALVTDAGTPGISDPGAVVVDILHEAGIKIVQLLRLLARQRCATPTSIERVESTQQYAGVLRSPASRH